MSKTGLTLGKFAPLHKGHQYLIEAALAEVDDLSVLIYDTPDTEIPLSVRAGWIRRLYPQVRVVEGWDGPDGRSSERAFEILQENYILHRLGGRKIDCFYSSESYGAHVSRALGALDRRVDEARLAVPVSGTAVRRNAYACRQFIDPVVYADLVAKVVFVGSMSTGKTTLATALAGRFKTQWVREYGREYWEQHQENRRLSLAGLEEIAVGHRKLEEAAVLEADKFLFVDTNAITTYMFSVDYHGRATAGLTRLAREDSSRYDLFFLCEDDIPYDDTWCRSGDQKRQVFQKMIVADLKERRIPYIPLRGALSERIARVEAVLASFRKYSNYYGSNVGA